MLFSKSRSLTHFLQYYTKKYAVQQRCFESIKAGELQLDNYNEDDQVKSHA